MVTKKDWWVVDGQVGGGSKSNERKVLVVCTLLTPLGSTFSPKVCVCLLVGLVDSTWTCLWSFLVD